MLVKSFAHAIGIYVHVDSICATTTQKQQERIGACLCGAARVFAHALVREPVNAYVRVHIYVHAAVGMHADADADARED